MKNLLEMEDILMERLGVELLLQEVLKAMSSDDEIDILKYIARNYEVDFE